MARPGWAFSPATAPAASPRSRIEFCHASASSRALETTYLVVAFMRAVMRSRTVTSTQLASDPESSSSRTRQLEHSLRALPEHVAVRVILQHRLATVAHDWESHR